MLAKTSRNCASSQPISTPSSSASCASPRNSDRFSFSTLIFSTHDIGSPSGVCQTGNASAAVLAMSALCYFCGVGSPGPPGAGASLSPGFLGGGENIIWPIRCSMLTEDWVNFIRPPGDKSLSDPPGTSDMYLSPSRPDETISATVSSGNLTAGSTVIRTVARNVLGSSVVETTEPTL